MFRVTVRYYSRPTTITDIIVTQTASKQYLSFIYKQVRKKTHLGSTTTIWFTHLARKAKP